jgi:hypothetical protein
VTVRNLPEENALILHETVEPDLAVFGDNYQVPIVVGKSERLDDVIDLNLMLDKESL